jgi:hypothetical protein
MATITLLSLLHHWLFFNTGIAGQSSAWNDITSWDMHVPFGYNSIFLMNL